MENYVDVDVDLFDKESQQYILDAENNLQGVLDDVKRIVNEDELKRYYQAWLKGMQDAEKQYNDYYSQLDEQTRDALSRFHQKSHTARGAESAARFLERCLNLQLFTLNYYKEPELLEQAKGIIAAKALEWYPASSKHRPSMEEAEGFSPFATGRAVGYTHTAIHMLAEGKVTPQGVAAKAKQKKSYSNSTQMEYIEHPTEGKGIRFIGANGAFSIIAADPKKFIGSDIATNKLFDLTLSKAIEQGVISSDGKIIGDGRVVFPLQLLVDLGIASSLRSARNMFNRFTAALWNLGICTGTQSVMRYKLFFTAGIQNSTCIVRLNNDYEEWNLYTGYYTLSRGYRFKLNSSRAYELNRIIETAARQHVDELRKTAAIDQETGIKYGYFDLGIRYAIDELNLIDYENADRPRETRKKEAQEEQKKNTSRNFKRDVIDPIDDAMKEISGTALDPVTGEIILTGVLNEDPELRGLLKLELAPAGLKDRPKEEYLAGHIRVTYGGILLDNLIEISKSKQRKKEDQERRKQAAIARNMAKKEG